MTRWLRAIALSFVLLLVASTATATPVYWNFWGSNGTESVTGFMRFDTPGTPSGFVPFGNRRNFIDQSTLSWSITGGVLDGDLGTQTDQDIYLDQGFAAQSIIRSTGGPATDYAAITFNTNALLIWGPNVEALPGGTYSLSLFNIAKQFTRTVGTDTVSITIDTLIIAPTPIPEPSTGLLVAGGMGLLALGRRRRAVV